MPSGIGPPDRTSADRLGLTVREFQRYRSQGIVKVDIQVSDGCTHITCLFGNRIWAPVMELGTITEEEVRYLRGPSAQSPG